MIVIIVIIVILTRNLVSEFGCKAQRSIFGAFTNIIIITVTFVNLRIIVVIIFVIL